MPTQPALDDDIHHNAQRIHDELARDSALHLHVRAFNESEAAQTAALLTDAELQRCHFTWLTFHPGPPRRLKLKDGGGPAGAEGGRRGPGPGP